MGAARWPRLLVRTPVDRAVERRYILDLVLTEWLGFEYDLVAGVEPATTILRHDAPEGAGLTTPDILLSTPADRWLRDGSMPERPLARVVVEPWVTPAGMLPVLYGIPTATGRALDRTASGLSTPIDLLGSAFWLLTRYEELVRPERDAHGRFPMAASLAAQEDLLERPLVDEYVGLIASAIRDLWPDLEPAARPFRLRLTHDIDQAFAAWGRPVGVVARAVAGDLVRRRDPLLAARRIRALIDARTDRVDRDPLATFDFLMDVSERHGLRSTFYFLAGTDPQGIDVRYRITDRPFGAVLRRIHDRGHEIGLHAGYGTYLSERAMGDELAALRGACHAAGVDQAEWGVRQHYLRLRYPDSLRIHEALGLAHDSTVGFAERVGFRAGTGREYPLFDVAAGRALHVRERPLVAMDTTLFEYMGLTRDLATDCLRSVVAACRKAGGDAVILAHNDRLAGEQARSWYREVVADLTRQVDE